MLPSLPLCSRTSYSHSNLMFRKFSGRSWRATFSHSSSCLANFRITWVKLEREMTHAKCLVCCPVLPTGPYRVLFPLMVFWLQPLGATESSNLRDRVSSPCPVESWWVWEGRGQNVLWCPRWSTRETQHTQVWGKAHCNAWHHPEPCLRVRHHPSCFWRGLWEG